MSTGTSFLAFATAALSLTSLAFAEPDLIIQVHDEDSRPLPCRVHLYDAAGQAFEADGLPNWNDHFVCPGHARVRITNGPVRYEIERGPEYIPATGTVKIADGKEHLLKVELERRIDMSARHWWSGELHIHRPIEQVPLHLQAEDLHVGPVITWWNGRNIWNNRELPDATRRTVDEDRFYDVMAGEDEREGGALLYFGLSRPLPLPGGRGAFAEHPSPMQFVQQAREHDGVWIDIEKPFWWDAPVWLASGRIDSVGLANNHMCRSRMYESEAWGRPRDTKRLPAPRGNGLWSQEIYYQILNSGLRVPPSAGSASGVLPNPVGYNRVYVHTGEKLDWAEWWDGLKAGRSFVTNGPLLICEADEHLPGHSFESETASRRIDLSIELTSNAPVRSVELVANGKVTVLADGPFKHARIEKSVEVDAGWFLVRAITTRKDTFRFASTAPWFVEYEGHPRRISRQAVQFFLDWIDERASRIPAKLADAHKLKEVLVHHDRARRFWNDRLNHANAP